MPNIDNIRDRIVFSPAFCITTNFRCPIEYAYYDRLPKMAVVPHQLSVCAVKS